jgi:4-hydroxymandelate oxidase
MRLDELVELEELAHRKLPPSVSEYIRQGSFAGLTTAGAPAAWDQIRFRPRMLRDVSKVQTQTTVLGHDVAAPVLVAPWTLQRAAHPDGELATARAVAAAGSLMVVSSNAGSRFEDIAATGARWWLQPYILKDRGLTTAMMQRGVAAGAAAVVLTVDTPVVGRKLNAGPPVWDVVPGEFMRVNIDTPDTDVALDKADDLTLDAIGWLAEVTGLPVVVKGVLRGDDAAAMVAAGAAAVWVSNHGGRQLDQAVSTAVALPEVAEAVAGSAAEVYVDGGLRKAEHVLAALALGASAAFLGRPVAWSLAAGGPDHCGGTPGVAELLAAFGADLAHVMALAGARDVSELSRDLIS